MFLEVTTNDVHIGFVEDFDPDLCLGTVLHTKKIG
jgi:hypothetical protein